MYRVVFDTNVVISGSLWSGAPKNALMVAREGYVKAIVSELMLDELQEVLRRPKFDTRLSLLKLTPDTIVAEYLQFTEIIETSIVPPRIQMDHDDEAILACALSANAHFLITGDPHLLELGPLDNISIIIVNTFLQVISRTSSF